MRANHLLLRTGRRHRAYACALTARRRTARAAERVSIEEFLC